MFFLALLSGSLFILPVAVTIGVFLGVERQRIFSGDASTGGGGGGGGIFGLGRPKVTTDTYCQKSYGITPFPGRWGDEQDLGDLCLNITTSTATKSSEVYAAGWSVTWQYPPGSADEPVHAFPNAKLELNDTIPAQLSDIKSLFLDVTWTYGLGNYIHNETNSTNLEAAGVNANVAVDMFFAKDKTNSTSTTDSDYEVMVWLGRWGAAVDPIGLASGIKANHSINGTHFSLYYGDNQNTGQTVFTWVADQNTTSFTGDLTPLVSKLEENAGPDGKSYLGYAAFGSEALYSFENVTFFVPRLEMDVQA
ncbi:concanavalin A-like lectin/glucanase [Rhizodiscina lignyota]|uniref:Concanavalin A-like lectin/glucanase n=1 Tax=Rhizodiscina lignyota TaxID=1504668 RepID=A0A9P4IQC3_9PEZI|nr:concanavalin A-like lectin/glucanase [Rhizodiscina lignyota]